MSNPTPKTDTPPELIVAALRDTIAALTERNEILEQRLARREHNEAESKTITDADSQPEGVFLAECHAAAMVLTHLFAALRIANGRALDGIQTSMIFRFLIDNSMRACACTALVAKSGANMEELSLIDPEDVNELFRKFYPDGMTVEEFASTNEPPTPFSKS